MNKVQFGGIFLPITKRIREEDDENDASREIVSHSMFTAGCVVLSPMEMEVNEFVRSFETTTCDSELSGRVDQCSCDSVTIVRQLKCPFLVIIARQLEMGELAMGGARLFDIDR